MTNSPAGPGADLFTPYKLGALELPNRVVMAPMTRNRTPDAGAPSALNARYYAQRAGAGLIVTEGTAPSQDGSGYANIPGLFTDAQQAGWAGVAEAVHAAGGRIFVQLMHTGRIGHPSLHPEGALPVAPSAVRPAGQLPTGTGMVDFETPRELATDELPAVRAEFVDAARRAVAAGLDGVELHAANGYLLHQFLADTTNVRTDAYGGSPQARARFVAEVAADVAAAIGGDRVGIRISPAGQFNDMQESDPAATYAALLEQLAPLGLAYLHVVEGPATHVHDALRAQWQGTFLLNTGFTGSSERDALAAQVAAGRADLVSVGRLLLANPDLVERWRAGAELNSPDDATFYGGDERGYTDYPTLATSGA